MRHLIIWGFMLEPARIDDVDRDLPDVWKAWKNTTKQKVAIVYRTESVSNTK